MSVRSKRLVAGVITTGTAATVIWTVPAGRTAIVHSAVIHLPSSSTAEARLILRTGTTQVDAVRQSLTGPQALRLTDQHWVLEAGDQISVQTAPTGLELRFWLSGSLLEGNPV